MSPSTTIASSANGGDEQGCEEDDDDAEEEEDWSSILDGSDCAWDGGGYAEYDRIDVPLSSRPGDVLPLDAVTSLAPLDVLGFWNGEYDPTGRRIWTGAIAFVEAFVRPLDDDGRRSGSDADRVGSRLGRLREDLFADRVVLELGCGTGVSGLALLEAPSSSRSADDDGGIDDDECDDRKLSDGGRRRRRCRRRPRFVTFTDSDPGSLALCERNCSRVLSSEAAADRCCAVRLEWGQTLVDEGSESPTSPLDLRRRPLRPGSYDAVVATDVLYDPSSLPPLLRTASDLLKPGGRLALSHVPRCSSDDDDDGGERPVGSRESLERLIATEAERAGLGRGPAETVRPRDLARVWQEALGGAKATTAAGRDEAGSSSYEHMDEVGAAILVFQKEETTN